MSGRLSLVSNLMYMDERTNSMADLETKVKITINEKSNKNMQ